MDADYLLHICLSGFTDVFNLFVPGRVLKSRTDPQHQKTSLRKSTATSAVCNNVDVAVLMGGYLVIVFLGTHLTWQKSAGGS